MGPRPASFFLEKHGFRRGHVVVEKLVPLDDQFQGVRQVLQQLHHHVPSAFEPDGS